MNDKDKEAFEHWADNDVLSHDENNKFKNMSDTERVIFIAERAWQAALEYERRIGERYFSLFNKNIDVLDDEVYRLQAENKKLREALENCLIMSPLDPFQRGEMIREALKEVGKE